MAQLITGRKSGFIQRGGRMRRETSWLFWQTVESTLGGAPTVVLTNSLNAAALAMRPFTIVRTRGVMYIRSDQAAASETYGAALGFAVVSNQASSIGVTAVPTPVADQGSDLFFVYEQLFSHLSVRSDIGQLVEGQFLKWDSKAMRKVNDDQDIVSVLENEIAGTVVVTSGRMLIKLH